MNDLLKYVIWQNAMGGGGAGTEKTVGPASLLSVSDALAKNAKALSVDISPVQSGSGDPSPSNIRPISGHTGISLLRCGKNLVDQETAPEFPRWIDTSNKWTYSSGGGKSLAVPCLPNTTYTLSLQGTTTVFRAGYIKEVTLPKNNSGSYTVYDATRNGSGPGSIKVTTGADATYIVVQVGAVVLRTSDLQIEFGSTATAYEKYNGLSISADWNSVAGTVYGGSLNVITGVLTVTDGYIASYSGETLPSTWISDRDVYAAGTSPTTGAEVVYKLATPVTYNLSASSLKLLKGTNYVFVDGGEATMTYIAGS